jgi:hypothetical protein
MSKGVIPKLGAFVMTWISLRLDDRPKGAVHVTTLDTHINIVPRMHVALVQLKSNRQEKPLMQDILHLNPRRQGDVADLVVLPDRTSFIYVICSQL